jgi:hypothetical protein
MFASMPVRGATATWAAIVEMIAPEGASGRDELLAATGLASSLIAAQAWADTPAVLSGVGAQLRIYCLYDEASILGEDANEESLSWSPTAGDWTLVMPCHLEDLAWARDAAAAISPRLVIADVSVSVSASETCEAANAAPAVSGLSIDVEEFLRG